MILATIPALFALILQLNTPVHQPALPTADTLIPNYYQSQTISFPDRSSEASIQQQKDAAVALQKAKSEAEAKAAANAQAQTLAPAPAPTQVVHGGLSDPAILALKMCESGNNYANKSNPLYRGAYQYDFGTWNNYGGYHDPADAPPEVQDAKFLETFAARGGSPWPHCARVAGLL